MNFSDFSWKKTLPLLLLFLILIFHGVNNYYWMDQNTVPLSWDQSWHNSLSVYYFWQFTQPGVAENAESVYSFIDFAKQIYPPLFHLTLFPLYLLFGVNEDFLFFTNLFFLAILIYSVFGIGKKIVNEQTGFYAAIFVSLIPIIYIISREFFVDLSLTSITAFAFYLLLKTNNFSDLKYSVFFGIIFGAGLLTKQTFILFIGAPLIFTVILSFIKIKKEGLKNNILIARNLVISILIIMFIASFWYLGEIPHLVDNLQVQSSIGILENDPQWNSIEGLLHYPIGLLFSVSIVFFLPFLFGLIRYKKLNSVHLLLWIFIPLILLTIFPNKDLRYMLPLIPAVAIISSFAINTIENFMKKKLVFYSLIILAFLQFFLISYSPDIGYSPNQGDWNINKIVDEIEKAKIIDAPGVLIIADAPYFNDSTFSNVFFTKKSSIKFLHGPGNNPLEFDFLIIKDGDIIEPTRRSPLVLYSKQLFEQNKEKFELVNSYPLPDESMALLYRRK